MLEFQHKVNRCRVILILYDCVAGLKCKIQVATKIIYKVAVSAPVRRLFDYLPPKNGSVDVLPGHRVLVPFGRSTRPGIVVEVVNYAKNQGYELKQICERIDGHVAIEASHLKFLQWVSVYYQYPIGEVIELALPPSLRKNKPLEYQKDILWKVTEKGVTIHFDQLRKCVAQSEILSRIRQESILHSKASPRSRRILRELEKKHLVCKESITSHNEDRHCAPIFDCPHQLNKDQKVAVEKVLSLQGEFNCYLLFGVTGSGKTTIYHYLVNRVLLEGRQALILVPEIGLTPQLYSSFRETFNVNIALYHSALTATERHRSWLDARSGNARIIIGTRSAVFLQLKKPGLYILDEEHDHSFKQHEGFRFHARDMAILRAKRDEVPIILGSASPSLESIHNSRIGKYDILRLPQRTGVSIPPKWTVLDMRDIKLKDGLSRRLLEAISRCLDQGRQALLFINRRGYSPVMICHHCGWVAECKRCDSFLVFHKSQGKQCCHHCGAQKAPETHCADCGSSDLRLLGQGTERVESALKDHFPDNDVIRIDFDSTRQKGSMIDFLHQVKDGRGQILVGTQMLAKGHDFPNVTLVGILDTDQSLRQPDFRASERLAQLLVQVAGRSGRGRYPGEVMIQTHYPDHPLLQTLINKGYEGFADLALKEREESGFPPFSYLALLRAEANSLAKATDFLEQARNLGKFGGSVGVYAWGPVAAPIEKRVGMYRAQLLLQSPNRQQLQDCLGLWVPQIEEMKSARRVRWSLDIDPVELL